jgi:hypothetical protein
MSERNRTCSSGRAVRNPERTDVGERHADVLRLTAGVAAHHVRVAEQTRARESVQLLRHPGIRVRVVTERPELPFAEEAAAACDRERDDDAVADAQSGVLSADLDDLAHELVAENVAGLQSRDEAVEQVQIRSADRRRRDADDRVTGIQDLRIRHALDSDVVRAVPYNGFHRRWPRGCPAVVGISPVSINRLKRRRSS